MLRVIAEHLDCSVKENCPFNQLINLIDSSGDRKLSHRSALNQLNRARVSFKHFGLEPKEDDVKKFRRDLEGFFPNATKLFLDVDFDSISLTNLIGHKRTENHLNEAERFIAEGNYKESICSSAKAFTIYHNRQSYSGRSILYWTDHPSRFEDPNIRTWALNVVEIIESLRSKFNLIMDGINLADYRKF